MTLWDWTMQAWSRPGVADACVAVQDDHGVNVCFLLWAAWSHDEARPLDVAAGVALARAWERDVAAPLRGVRRAVKLPRRAIDPAAREAFRAEVKRVELAAERLLLSSLEALPPGPAPVSFGEAVAGWPNPPPAPVVSALHLALTNRGYAPGSEPSA